MPSVDFAISVDYKVEIWKKQKNVHILGPCKRTKKAVEPDVDGDIGYK